MSSKENTKVVIDFSRVLEFLFSDIDIDGSQNSDSLEVREFKSYLVDSLKQVMSKNRLRKILLKEYKVKDESELIVKYGSLPIRAIEKLFGKNILIINTEEGKP